MSLSVDQFGKALVSAGLFSADELKALWNAIPADARPKQGDGFAKLLVQQGKLNPFQADELLSGRNTPLVMGDYLLVAELGAGGMGKVYKARHRRMERIVALKVMSTAAMQDEAAVKRFQREVKAAARLEHPNIVTAYDSGESGKVKYLVMQFVDGGDLSQLVKQSGPLEIERAVDYVLQAARGLGFAHGEGVVHRDIKPANLLLDKKGVVKILDMGLARIEGGDGLTATEQVMGTVDYMSPEQAANTKTADGRSDIYSLGCTLWFLLTAKKVYDGDTMISRLMSHRTDPLPSLVKARDGVPWSLEQAFHKMIAKSPEERFQSMDEVVAALEPFAPSGGSRSGLGSSIGMGPQSAEMASFLKSIGPAVKPQTKPAPTGTKVDVEATAQLAAAGADTDPKSQLLPPSKKAPQPQAKGSGKKPPPNKNLLLAAAGGGALLVLLGVWFIFRDKDGNEVARVQMPAGGSVTVQQPASTAGKTPVATATRPISFFMPTGTAASPIGTASSPVTTTGAPPTVATSSQLPAGVVYLDDLQETKFSSFVRMQGKHGVDNAGKPLQWHGRQPAHSLSMHAHGDGRAASIEYLLAGKFQTLTAAVGLNNHMVAKSPLTFRVLGDGRELWKSPPIHSETREAFCSVSVAGVQELRLEAVCDGSNYNAYAVWIEPRLTPVAKPVGPAPPLAVAPFDAAGAKAHQQAWARHLGTEVVKPNSIGMQMTLIPPGEFLMGSSDADITLALKIAAETKLDEAAVKRIQEERPQHLVRITQPFRLASHEVTIGQFSKFVEQAEHKTQAEEFGGNSGTVNPEEVKPDSLKLNWRTPGTTVTDDSPVTQVNWNDAVAFCNWLSGQEQRTPCYQRDGDSWTLLPKANGYRLPTEAEWEYACRAGTTTQLWFGDDWKEHDKYGWSKNNSGGRPHVVGSLPANPFGLYDTHGNVWEWCQDWYDGKWYEKSPSDDPFGPSRSSNRVARGGSWNDMPAYSRSPYRSYHTPSYRGNYRGFRPALSSVGATASVTASSQPVTPTSSAGRNTPKYTNTLGMEFALVPKGKSWLGGGGGKPGEQEVEIKQDFYMGVYEVTQEEWEKVTGKNPSEFSRNGVNKNVVSEISDADLKRFPVDQASWDDCQNFIKAINDQVKETGWVYRLPTEVEWEYACRGGPMADKAESAFDFYLEKPTNTLLASQANFMDTNLNRTNKVGSYSPNRLGLFDMHGNVGEWCQDEFPAAPNAPSGAVQHAVRGGSFGTRTEFRRTSLLKTYPLTYRGKCGLRLVRVPIDGAETTTSVTPQPAVPAAASGKLFMHDPAFPQWVKDVQAMPAEQQIEAVSKKLMELNPGFDGKVTDSWGRDTPKIEAGMVTEYGFFTATVTDISPVRALSGLKSLRCTGLSQGGEGDRKLTNLSPLSGMHLTFLDCTYNYQLFDLSPLNEMPLVKLHCFATSVSELSPLQSCERLQTLRVGRTKVTPASVAALQTILPNCKIEWDDPAKAPPPPATGTQ